jgi:hypothetical protein
LVSFGGSVLSFPARFLFKFASLILHLAKPSEQGGTGMQPKGFHRKLAAILSADVAGYRRLMQDDEAATVKTLEAYQQIISDLVKQHRGRVVDSPGDNLLAETAFDHIESKLPLGYEYLGNRFFMRMLEESPKKEVYQCPSS